MSDLDAAADDLIADLLGGGDSSAPAATVRSPPISSTTATTTTTTTTTPTQVNPLQSVIRGDTRRATLSEQLGWLRDGLPRSLWKPLTSRAAGVLNGEVALLRPYFEDQPLVTSTRCTCTQCDELFASPVKLPCGDTFSAECVEDIENRLANYRQDDVANVEINTQEEVVKLAEVCVFYHA